MLTAPYQTSNKPFSTIEEISSHHYVEKLLNEIGKSYQKNCTSLPALDQRIKFVEGYTILAGKAKTGKSTLAQQIAENYARNGIIVIYYDFEMGWKRFFKRSFQRFAGIDFDQEIQKQDNTILHQKLDAYSEYHQSKLTPFYYYRHAPTLQKLSLNGELLKTDINAIRQKHSNSRIVLFIDSLQKLPITSMGDRRSSIDMWLRFIEKSIAYYNISVFSICELSRAGLYKESGDIEYTADNCLNLMCEDPKNKKDILKLNLEYSRDFESGYICTLERKRPSWKFVQTGDYEDLWGCYDE